jgi:hypothetical protein
MNLRKLAQGRECQIRIPNCCNHDPATTVGCHYRMAALSGIGIKSHDLFIAWGCSACHDAVDKLSSANWTADQLRLMHAEGVFRTQLILLQEEQIGA